MLEDYMELINIYLKKCIDYFMGESDAMTIIKFNTFDFSETMEYIFTRPNPAINLVRKVMKGELDPFVGEDE